MEPVRYYVPTRGRVGKQTTVRNLPASLRSLITIVCPADEVSAHRADWPEVQVVAQPDAVKTIGAKREWIYRELAQDVDWAWQLDDDLKFKTLSSEKTFRVTSGDEKIAEALARLQAMANGRRSYHHDVSALGIGTSFMAPKGGFRENYHLGFAFAFDRAGRDILEMNRLDVFEDIDFTLQALRKGYGILTTYDVVVDQVKADAPGGVTGERTEETIRASLKKLIEFHPGIVQEKPRREGAHPAAITRVAWAKAAKEGGLK
jgi:hypothetical protein